MLRGSTIVGCCAAHPQVHPSAAVFAVAGRVRRSQPASSDLFVTLHGWTSPELGSRRHSAPSSASVAAAALFRYLPFSVVSCLIQLCCPCC